jgi:hypothetical protein
MAQDLTVNIKTTSDVPQAMDKAKAATVSFSKQVDDIGRKFSTAFKDIAFALVAPVVLLNSAISFIQSSMEEARRQAKEGLDLISEGESKFASSEETKTAAFFKRRKQLEEERNLIKAGRESLTEQILVDRDLAKGLVLPDKIMKRLQAGESVKGIAKDEEMQRIAMDYLKETEAGRKILAESTPQEVSLKSKADKEKAAADAKDLAELKAFAGKNKPGEIAGYGNVIGVGSNIAIEMAQMQIDELKRHTELLQMIATKESVAAVDFSKGDKSNTTPSRAKLLSGK